MDDAGQHGYRFDNASVTESCRVELGPLPLLVLGLWGRNRIEACEVAEISRLGAARRHRILSRIAWRDHDAGQFGAGRRHPRRTQTADAFQLGRVPARTARAGSRPSASSPRTVPRISRNSRAGASLAAPPSCWIPAAARSTIPSRSAALPQPRCIDDGRRQRRNQTRAGRPRQRGAGSLLRVDVRVPAAVGQDPLRARSRACPRAPDLDGRSRRRRQGRQLHRAGPDDRRARHRPSRQIHVRHGRRRRFAVAGAQRAAVGRSARIVADRIAADQSRDHRCGRRRAAAGQCRRAGCRS